MKLEYGYSSCCINIIRIIHCLEGDKSDSQSKSSSVARSQSLKAMVVLDGLQFDLSSSTKGVIAFITPKSIIHSPCLSVYFGPFYYT